jgi:hypothetical protein
MDVLRVVARTDSSGILLQTNSRLDQQRLQTQELRAFELGLIDRWMGLRDDGQAFDSLLLDDAEVETGRWELADGSSLPAMRINAQLTGSFSARSNVIPFTIELEACVSPAVAMEGVLRLKQTTTYEIGDNHPVGTETYELVACGRGPASVRASSPARSGRVRRVP